MSTLLTQPSHSLIDQSLHARQNDLTTNGDGFGVGWYAGERYPGTFHDTHPAWNNVNLHHLARHIHSHMFLAHVRATTGTPVQDTNCHPFGYESWLFQHNGSVPDFKKLKRQLLLDIDPPLFPNVLGSTDSEILFYLALTFGLAADPQSAMERMVGHVEGVRQAAGVEEAFYLSAVASDGRRMYAVRYSSDGDSPTLFHSCHVHALRAIHPGYDLLHESAVIVLSEPLDDLTEHWKAIPESSFVIAGRGEVEVRRFTPRSA